MDNPAHKIPVIPAAIGVAARLLGCEEAPAFIQALTLQSERYQQLDWRPAITCGSSLTQLAALPAVADFSTRLAEAVAKEKATPLLVIGGDHACAIGTWSGIAKAHGPFGLIWMDAHMDSHTPEDSESGNIHGMPVASLLGRGDVRLTQVLGMRAPVLPPQQVVLIGTRSFEASEAALLADLGVRVYNRETVRVRGIQAVLQEAVRYLQETVSVIGMSVDLDVFEPRSVPAVCAPEPDGLAVAEFLAACRQVLPPLVALEITEFNPTLPGASQTAEVVLQLIETIL